MCLSVHTISSLNSVDALRLSEQGEDNGEQRGGCILLHTLEMPAFLQNMEI